MGSHIVDGQFQSDKYPTTPRGKVPLSVRDSTAQDLLWEYAQRRRRVDSEFSGDLESALLAAGYVPADRPQAVASARRCDACDPSFGCFADPASCCKRPPGMTWRSLRDALDALVGGCIGALDRAVVVRLDFCGRSVVGGLRAVTTGAGTAEDPSLVLDGGDGAASPDLVLDGGDGTALPDAGLTCDHCGARQATCFGRYESPGQPELACDACCGHGGEDGWCRPIGELWSWALQLYASRPELSLDSPEVASDLVSPGGSVTDRIVLVRQIRSWLTADPAKSRWTLARSQIEALLLTIDHLAGEEGE
jgi:hypothetical protein